MSKRPGRPVGSNVRDDVSTPQSVWSSRTDSRLPSITGTGTAEVAGRLLRLLTSGQYRKASVSEADRDALFRSLYPTLIRQVRTRAPIQLTLMAFPFKVPNPAKTGSRTLPDFAELSAIRRLLELARRVQAIYPAGLRIELIHDGRFLADLFGVPVEEVAAYESYFGRLVELVGLRDVITTHDFGNLQRANGLTASEEAIARLEDEAVEWYHCTRGSPVWLECFRKTLGMVSLRHLPLEVADTVLESGAHDALADRFPHIEALVHQAMIDYRVKDAVIHRFDPRPVAFPEAIHTTTRRQPGRLALWLIRRGQGLLPWHGVGAIDTDANPRVMLARDVARRPELRPMFLPGETTPFCFGAEHHPHRLVRLLSP